MFKSTRISKIDVLPFDVPLINPFTIASTHLKSVNNFVVVLELENGIKGYGEGTILHPVTNETQALALDLAHQHKDCLLNMDINRWRPISETINGLFEGYGVLRNAFETAVFDALTRCWSMPLFQFFGGRLTELDTDITIPICSEAQAEHLAGCYRAQGFTTLKTKIGLDLDDDIKRLLAIKRGFPNCCLVLDANEGYSLAQAQVLVHTLKQFNIEVFLLEQPVSRNDFEGMQQLTRESKLRIVADESCHCALEALKIAEKQAAHVLNIKLAKCGVLESLDIVGIAKAAGLGLMMGEMVGTRLGTGFSVHFAAGIGGFENIDLDTPLLLAEDPVSGGYRSKGKQYQIDVHTAGIGAAPVLS